MSRRIVIILLTAVATLSAVSCQTYCPVTSPPSETSKVTASASTVSSPMIIVSKTPYPIDESNLKLVLTMEKKLYSTKDAVSVMVTIQNTGPRHTIIKKRLVLNNSFLDSEHCDLYFKIVSPTGETLDFVFLKNVGPLNAWDFMMLDANESFSRVFVDLRDDYWLQTAGSYSIYAVYRNTSDREDGKYAWKGELVSNELTFTIQP